MTDTTNKLGLRSEGPFSQNECSVIRTNAVVMYQQAYDGFEKPSFSCAGDIPTPQEREGMNETTAAAYAHLITVTLEAAASKSTKLFIVQPRTFGPQRIRLDTSENLSSYASIGVFSAAIESIDLNNLDELKFKKATYTPPIASLHGALTTRCERNDLLWPIFQPMILETFRDAYPSPAAILLHSLRVMTNKADKAKLG